MRGGLGGTRSRSIACTLFGFVESFGNETIEPGTEKEFRGLCCSALIGTFKKLKQKKREGGVGE